ncbi:AraC family transcriptional regulator [Roseibium sp. MMSF_3544]|uniref:AraC family transcriptional regulator n=1 Tax=unclassified Roseibium TaxID=2629323 RepID=UPI00273DD4B8|nr:AraC family transcriptional regulator [Roseibium sp. MMSF_3544]
MSNDPLTNIIGSLDLLGAVFLNAEFSSPWAVTARLAEREYRSFFPVPRQVIAYHLVTEGEAIVTLEKSCGYHQERRVRAGDVVFLPSNAPHVLASGTGAQPVRGDNLLSSGGFKDLTRIVHGGGGMETRILCGFIACNSEQNPLLNTLPDLLVINIESLDTRRWIEASITKAAREFAFSRRSSDAMVCGMCRLLLIEALRIYVDQNPSPGGWLKGMAHPRIGRALARIHTSLGTPPRVEDLAGEIGMSRSAFVDRFTEVMGMAPRKYILTQRMETAAALLRTDGLTMAEIAYRVGYDAPEAFSRAFKREMGRSPVNWRMRSQDAA